MVLTDASRAQSTDDQVKDLMRRYEEVEGQLDRSVRYAGKTESDGQQRLSRRGIMALAI